MDPQNPPISTSGPSKIPPPPTEFSIRTMASDLEAMATSGGNTPQFMPVSVAEKPAGSSSGKKWVTPALILLGIIILSIAAYFAFFAK